MSSGFSKRKTSVRKDGSRSTTTVNNVKGVTTSISTGNKNRRLTTSHGPDGKVKQTETIHVDGLGVRRTTRTIASRSNNSGTSKHDLQVFFELFALLIRGFLYLLQFRWFQIIVGILLVKIVFFP